ncbi:hypothetical protein [Xylophilus sp.]|uniref:hypothetical protein n=1 Tax=Xylophilus sp. TaxID=2653893 RepID=UPI0013BDB9EF|nr:hypothetical protein [Xylophilus sp.]KAF1050260.1 MAG: hypothetical protein GAK38_00286 [Xylophilus sp.]
MLNSLLDPQALLFFAVFLPPFAGPGKGPVGQQLVVLGGIRAALGTVFHTLLGEAPLTAFASASTHLQAKRQFRRWYGGYHVVVSKVERACGDGSLEHFVPDSRRPRTALIPGAERGPAQPSYNHMR